MLAAWSRAHRAARLQVLLAQRRQQHRTRCMPDEADSEHSRADRRILHVVRRYTTTGLLRIWCCCCCLHELV
jgi:septum formation topological specificity factor MinE